MKGRDERKGGNALTAIKEPDPVSCWTGWKRGLPNARVVVMVGRCSGGVV